MQFLSLCMYTNCRNTGAEIIMGSTSLLWPHSLFCWIDQKRLPHELFLFVHSNHKKRTKLTAAMYLGTQL